MGARTAAILFLVSCAAVSGCSTAEPPPFEMSFAYAQAIPPTPGTSRRDPSDVICVDGIYYVWYTRITNEPGTWQYPSGYSGILAYATSPDGKKWTEQGPALGKGEKGAWDEHGVFTPNILVAGGRYCLFYTGVPRPFSAETPTAIGVAVSESPAGPWKRTGKDPVLLPSRDPAKFDSFRVDDACLVARDGKYFLYYKGRQQDHTPRETKMGVAIAERPEGPYVKCADNPLIGSGHEVLVWPHGRGVASMVTSVGPEKNTIQYALDGLKFSVRSRITGAPHAAGSFRSDHFRDGRYGTGMRWGIDHAWTKSRELYLRRFDLR